MRYKLPKEVYHRTQWLIRDYPRLKAEYEAAINQSPVMDGQPKGTGISDPTEREAELRLKYGEDVSAIEKGFSRVPEEYRKGLYEAIVLRKRYPDYAGLSTWKRWRQRLVFYVAKYKGWW